MPTQDTTFHALPVAAVFRFRGSPGRWRKLSARRYEDAANGQPFRVGSIHVGVVWSPPDDPFNKAMEPAR